MKKAILYLRFSDTKQLGNTSFETQEKVCRNACLTEGFKVVESVKNKAVSASKTNTQRVAELLEFCKARKGKFDVLMVYKLDRFARSQEQHHWLRGQLLKMGVILRSATEKIDESPSGRLVEGVLAAVNEYDNEVKRERVKLAMWARVEQGLYPWQPPLGYRPNKIPGVKLSPRVFDENCKKAVVTIFEKYSTGLYSKAELAKEFSKKKLKDYKSRVIKFSIQTIHSLLNNTYYYGYLKHQDGRLIKGQHKPLISATLFEKCQEVQSKLSNNANHKYLVIHPDFPLRRFTLCGVCNRPLTACWSKSKSGKRYAYYYCKNSNCEMYSKMVSKANLENQFMDYLSEVKPTNKFVKRFNKIFLERYKERELEIKGDYFRQMDEIKRLEDEQRWIIEKGKKGLIPDNLLKEQLQEVEKKITLAKMQLSETHSEELDVNALLSYAEEFIRTLETSWFDAPSKVKTKLQKAVFPEGVHYEYPGFSNTKISPIFEVINKFVASEDENVTLRGVEPRFLG